MRQFAARFECPTLVHAGYVGEPGTPQYVEMFHPCVGCWEEKEVMGAIVGEDHKTLIHVEKGPAGTRASPAYYCEPCWAREVQPRIEAFAQDADVTLVEGGRVA